MNTQTNPSTHRENASVFPGHESGEVRILIFTAIGRHTVRLRLDEEVREIGAALARSKYGSNFKLIWRPAARIDDFREALTESDPHIVHFSGHGDQEGICVVDDIGLSKPYSNDALAALLELFKDSVSCVVFNSCGSEALVNTLTRHIDYSIGTQCKLMDSTGIKFSSGFYNALGAGKSIETAFRLACVAVSTAFPKRKSEGIPVLKIREGVKGERLSIKVADNDVGGRSPQPLKTVSTGEKTSSDGDIVQNINFKGKDVVTYQAGRDMHIGDRSKKTP